MVEATRTNSSSEFSGACGSCGDPASVRLSYGMMSSITIVTFCIVCAVKAQDGIMFVVDELEEELNRTPDQFDLDEAEAEAEVTAQESMSTHCMEVIVEPER